MGAILPFVPRAAAIDNARPLAIEAAAIIIFPGVRYERVGDSVAAKAGAGVSNAEKTGPARH